MYVKYHQKHETVMSEGKSNFVSSGNLKNKTYFTSKKVGLLREWQGILKFKTSKSQTNHWQTQQTQQGNVICMEKKEEIGRGCFEGKSVGIKQDLWVMRVSHWLSCRGNKFLREDAMYIFLSVGTCN